MTVPIEAPAGAATSLSLASSEVRPDTSVVRFASGTGAEVRIEIVPSPIYRDDQDRNRPDRVQVSDGHSTVEKDVYPAGAGHSLSRGDAVLSTVVAMPPSGSATEPANVLVELAPNGAGAILTLCLQKTSQRNTAQVPGFDNTAEPARLLGIRELPADEHGNARRQASIRISGRNARTVELELISWRQTGTVQEGYTWRLHDPAGARAQNGGFTNPPSSSARDFHTRVLDTSPGRREIITGDQRHGIQLVTPSAGGLTFGFSRGTPQATTVQVRISSQGGSTTRTLPYSGAVFSPTMVEDSGGGQGSLAISLNGSGTRHMSVSWLMRQGSRELPRLDSGTGHVVLANYSQTQIDLQISGLGAERVDLQWAWPPLPDDVIAPPKWRRWSNGYETGWIRDSGSRIWIPDGLLYPQVHGAQIAGMLFDITAITAIRMIPIVGPLVMIGEAVAGREIITGRRMSDDERVLHGALAGLGLVLELGIAYAAARGSGDAASGAASVQVRRVVTTTQLTEAEAQNLLTVAARVTGEERALVAAARAELAAGRQLTQSQLNQIRNIMARVHAEMLAEARQSLVNTLQARNATIEAARGDINVFRTNVRVLAASGNTQRPLAEVVSQLNQLLTPYRRVRILVGGGRGAGARSTIIESLDGQFSMRITHTQVGLAPIGSPPHPRIHMYRGPPSGHGSHILLPDGTTLADILAALGL